MSKHSKIPAHFINPKEPKTESLSADKLTPVKIKSVKMYHDEALLSFFRRPAFSPDGSLFLTPAGQIPVNGEAEQGDKEESFNTVFLYSRGSLLK